MSETTRRVTPPSSPAPRAPLDKRPCEKRIWQGFHQHQCAKTAKVERGGVWYCGTHDPEKVAARQAKLEAKWRHESNILRAQQAVIQARNAAADLIERGNMTEIEIAGAQYRIRQARAALAALESPPRAPLEGE